MRFRYFPALLILAIGWAAPVSASVVEEIREEATRPNSSPVGWPLPLAAHWSRGDSNIPGGYTPAYQVDLIKKGHHLLPWFTMPAPTASLDDTRLTSHFQQPLAQFQSWGLPISLVGTQWESRLSGDAYLKLPRDTNPNTVAADGSVSSKVSPLGGIAAWREVGESWTSSPWLRRLQLWYPNPPLVLFVSNNEHSRLRWHEAEQDARFVSRHGTGTTGSFRRKVFSEGWSERYRALKTGMRNGLKSSAWKDAARFIGYEAFGPRYFGRWWGWVDYGLHIPDRIDPNPLYWDGGSPSFYLDSWSQITDYTVWSPQVEAMNWVFMLKEALKLNPSFWFEISTYDGHTNTSSDKRKFFASKGQTYTPARYAGMVQYGMWLLRPRVVREYRDWTDTVAASGDYFMAVVESVDRVYTNDTLKAFWRNSELVPNRAHPHPYGSEIPAEYASVDRWFLLNTNLDPPRPWTLYTEIPVFSLSRVKGTKPNRRWLLYAHSPLRDRTGVIIQVPDYGSVTVDVPIAGCFYVIDEAQKSVQRVSG